MYRSYEGGTVEHIQGLDCNIPPVGFVWDEDTGRLERRPIISRSAKKADQYWQREGLPKDWKERRATERRKQAVNPDYVDPILEKFREREWDRRLNGVWFMNNGEPTYITGLHYFYLTWIYMASDSKINRGYPDYWDSDRQLFYFLEYTIQDPRSAGIIYVTKRREGKTQKSVSFLLDLPTRRAETNAGIQSKTEKDAKEVVFQKGVVRAFKRLPDFFMPKYDTSSTLKTSLDFIEPVTKGRGSRASIEDKDELDSHIDWRSSTETAYDGTKLHRYVGDEVFKTEKCDIVERHRVVSFCVKDHNGQFIGKMFYTSTVEDIEGTMTDIKVYRQLYRDSDPRNRNEVTGRTGTGLYAYFLPGDEARNRDIYGKCDREKNREQILAERPDKNKDPRGYYSACRKDPLSIEEAFRSSEMSCMFDAVRLNDRMDFLSWQDNKYEVGNFEWKNGDKESGEVVWHKVHNGRFKVRFLFSEGEGANNVIMRGGRPWPGNPTRFVLGVDPYDHDVTVDTRRSDGAFYVRHKHHSMYPEWSKQFVVEYRHRPPTADIFYEDVLKACHYFGAPMLFESNKIGIKKYFEARGYGAFLMTLPGRTEPGVPATKDTKQELAECLEDEVYNNCENIWYPNLITDLLEFDIHNTEKFDSAMAAGWTLLAEKRIVLKAASAQKYEAKQIFRPHKVTTWLQRN